MAQRFDEQQLQTMQEEIRNRVFERYAEQQGMAMQEHELQATLDALQEITHLPMAEIEQIAAEVQHGHRRPQPQQSQPAAAMSRVNVPQESLAFKEWETDMQRRKRAFLLHAVPYVFVNAVLIFLNIKTSSFPWAMFPLLGWSIGFVSHYLSQVYWPQADFRHKVAVLQRQVADILAEHLPDSSAGMAGKMFNGVYRLVVSESSPALIRQYLKSIDPAISEAQATQITTQFEALQQRYLQKS